MVFAHCHRKNMNQRTPTSVLRNIIFCISLLSIHIIHVHSFQFQTNRNRNRNRGISSIRTSTRTIRMAHNHNLNKRASPTKHTSNPYAYREIRVPSRSLFSSSTYSHSSDGHASGRGVEFTRLNQSSNPDNVNVNGNNNGNVSNGNSNVNVNTLGKRRRASRTISKLFSSLPGPLNFSKSSDTETEFDATTATATKISLLEQENEILRQTVSELERENDFLGKNINARKSIIMEQFEGEGQPMVDSSGQQIDPTWWENNNVHANANANANANVGSGDVESQSFNLGLTNRAFVDDRSRGSSSISTNDSSFSAAARNNTTISFASSSSAMAIPVPPPPLEECNVDVLADGSCPLEPDISFKDALKDRAKWLVGLLALQSMSGFILARNELLLQTHPVIVYFLTMLVGAGGNAGNQAAVRVIRGIALGTLNENTQRQFLNREFKMACSLSAILSVAGFIRATAFNTPIAETVAVTTALSIIVFTSICFGAVLPLILRSMNVDPAHSSTTIQVIMDILGVVLTVFVSTTILDTPFGQMIIGKLTGA